jgi:peptide deformylase
MAIIPIYNCYHPILKVAAEHIEEVTPDIKTLVANMFETLATTENGVGLAANQVGKAIALFIIDLEGVKEYENKQQKYVFINPDILWESDATNSYNEGCLSVPTLYEDVERPASIEIKYQDIDMHEHTQKFDGFLARVIQHEYDHLDGVLFFERISSFKRTLAKNRLRHIKAGDYETEYPMIQADGKSSLS